MGELFANATTIQGRNFNIQLQVGQDVLEAMCYTNFKVTGEIFPMLRVAMWCTILGTNKHQDNIQRILTKADLDKLKAANAKEKVITAEHQLLGAWPIVAKTTVEDQTHSYKCFGRMCARTILFLVGKQKHSRESKVYEDLAKSWKPLPKGWPKLPHVKPRKSMKARHLKMC